MPSFRTELPPLDFGFRINHEDVLLSIGSCFTKHIGNRLKDLKINDLLNPFGIVYNPISISNQLHYLLSDRMISEKDLFWHNEQWHSFAHHSSFSGTDKVETLAKMNASLMRARTQLEKTNRLMLTLGSSNVFIYRQNGEIVANCHKLSGQEFERKRLHIRDIVEALEPNLRAIKRRNPDLQVIFTVSPVRHLRDGFIQNQRSKAALVIAIQHLSEDLDYVHYFPSYEIMMDELRDYRFYDIDMIHSNQIAIDYIWQRFGAAFFEEETIQLNAQIDAILKAARHRPFNPESQSHQGFLGKQLERIAVLEKAHPDLDFSLEREIFLSQLI